MKLWGLVKDEVRSSSASLRMWPPALVRFVALMLCLVAGDGPAASITWVGNGGGTWTEPDLDTDWNAAYNSGDNVTFDDTAAGATTLSISGTVAPGSVTVNNTVRPYIFNAGGIGGSASLTKLGAGMLTFGGASSLGSLVLDGPGGGALVLNNNLTCTNLSLQNTSGANATHTNTVAAGQTFTANGPVTVGNTAAIAGITTVNYFTGGGALVVAGTDMYIGSPYSITSDESDILDLSGLNTFAANVNSLGVAYGYAGLNSRGIRGTLMLAASNTITATNLYVGGGISAGVNSTSYGMLELGATNMLNVGNIAVGVNNNRPQNLVMFNPTLTAPGTVVIRGVSGGSSTAALTLGLQATGTGNYHNQVDLTAGILDARFGNVTLQGSGQNGYYTTQFAIGRTTGGGADFTGGTLTIGYCMNSAAVNNSHPEGALYLGATNGTAAMTAGVIKLAVASGDTVYGPIGGTLTVGTNAALAVTSKILMGVKGSVATNSFATLNLNSGGVMVVPAGGIITTGTVSGVSTGTNINTMSFDGGTLRLSSSGNLFSGTNIYIYILSGGATLDVGTNNVSVEQAFSAAAGSGIASIAVTNGGSGYFAAPYVQITDPAGSGASAFAQINNAGKVTNIVVTSRGQNYSSPVVSLFSGSTGSAGGVSNALIQVTGGGLTKLGQGTLTLSGTNTYEGATSVSNGILNVTGSIASTNWVIGSGATLAFAGATNLAGKVLTIDPTGSSAGLLSVNGDLTLGGALRMATGVSLTNCTSRQKIIQSTTAISGSFSDIALPKGFSYFVRGGNEFWITPLQGTVVIVK